MADGQKWQENSKSDRKQSNEAKAGQNETY